MRTDSQQIVQIKLSDIVQRENSRGSYGDLEMSELMTSMKQIGQLQPIGLRAVDKNHYEVVFGNRRFVAAKKLGWETVGAVFVAAETEEDFLVKNGNENLHVAVPLPEQGRIFDKLNKKGLTMNEIGIRFSISDRKVKNALDAFRRIPVRYQSRIVHGAGSGRSPKAGMISPGVATSILSTAKTLDLNKTDTEKLFELATEEKVSTHTVLAVGKLISQGYSIREALKSSKQIKVIQLNISIHEDEVSRVESKHQTGIARFLYDILEADGRVKILRFGGAQPKVIVRKKK